MPVFSNRLVILLELGISTVASTGRFRTGIAMVSILNLCAGSQLQLNYVRIL
jgi:hypothetical protein